MPAPTLIRDLQKDDLPWVIKAHKHHYTHVEKFDDTFSTAVTNAIDSFYAKPHPSVDRAFLLENNAARGGCIFCVHERALTARLKLFYLEPPLRGRGYGKALLKQVLEHVASQDYRQIIVSTYSAHEAACALYAKTGFSKIDERATIAFGRALTEQTWCLDI